jgi:peptide/nickel transport system substrate-binding protein
MLRKRKLTKFAVLGTAVVTAVFVLAVGTTSFATTSKAKATTATTARKGMVPVPGGTLTVAETPVTVVNWFFPVVSAADFSVANFQVIYNLYRPLYYFGLGATPDLNAHVSVADLPVFSNGGKTITIKMKGYKWSNGETVDAQDILFWSNLMKVDGTSWGGYAPGPNQYPGNIVNVVANNATDTVTLTLDHAYSSYWYTYNELGQVSPLPIAWDITSATAKAGSGGCSRASYTSVKISINSSGLITPVSAAAKACAAVFSFLTSKTEAADLGTVATNPLWRIVDGPFYLSAYDATTGATTLTKNPAYSGSPKPMLDNVDILPFTSDASEFDVIASGGNKINFGYIPPVDLPVYKGKPWCGTGPCVGKNNAQLAASYNLEPVLGWGYSYIALNYTNPTYGPIFKQLYVRQAMQMLQNQPLWLQLFDAGYGAPTLGPVPAFPPTNFVSSDEKTVLYPYNPAKAVSLLKSHGWNVVPDGVTTCAKPGTASNECGAGIKVGAQMSFPFIYATGAVAFESQMKEMQASWAQAGIKVGLAGKSFDDVIGTAFAPCVAGKTCAWTIADWGGGWIYSPDYFPTGEELYACGAGSNAGQWCDPTTNNLILATNDSSSLSSLYNYENYLSVQLPSIWQPLAASALDEVGKNVCGYMPLNVLLEWNFEYWYFCKAG